MKQLFLLFFFAVSYCAFAQTTYKTSAGYINFNASTPLEDIDATNKEVNAIIKPETGGFASVLLIKDFSFRRKLMQEHFNENYMDSETYPKAYFSGTIQNFNPEDLGSEKKQYTADGKLTIRGVTKQLRTTVFLRRSRNNIVLDANFIVKPEDHDIEVPKLLFKKIAQEVKVAVSFAMTEQ